MTTSARSRTIEVMAKAKSRATYDDLLALPAHVVGEIIDGELIASPRPSPRHAHAAAEIGTDLVGSFGRGRGGPGGWLILPEPELHFGAEVVVPDLVGWRQERLQQPPATPFLEVRPDWVCEIVSPSTARVDRTSKMALYARVHVLHMWIVDPLAMTLEVFRLEAGRWTLLGSFGSEARVCAEPFGEVEIDLSRWWWVAPGE